MVLQCQWSGYHSFFHFLQYHHGRYLTNLLHLEIPSHCMALRKTLASPLLKHWRFHSIALYLLSQCSDISLDYHLRYCSVICTKSSIFQNRDRYNTDDTEVWDHGQNRRRHSLIQKSFCRTIKNLERHKLVARMFYHTSLAGNSSHRGPVNSPHKWPVTRKMVPFDDVIMFGCKYRCPTALSDNFG